MANFGFSDLVVVNPYEPVWRETRAAPGAEALVHKARVAPSIAAAVRGCDIVLGTSSFHQRPLEQAIVLLPDLPDYLSSYKTPARVAVLFGSERSGLSNEELSSCRAVIQIPTRPDTPSMNLAQAVSVILYEFVRSSKVKTSPRFKKTDLESLIHIWISLAQAADYPAGYRAAARAGRVRRALQGARLDEKASAFLTSFSRWLLKKLPSRP